MPPKIGGMVKQLILLLHGEDRLEEETASLAGHGLAHEQYLIGKSFPLGAALAGQLSDPNQVLMCIEPVHLHATRDHLVLLQLEPFHVPNHDIEQLMNEASSIFIEEGLGPLIQVAPFQWLGKTEVFKTLHTHSALQAQGRNIDWWLPKDTKEIGLAKRWRKIQNEVQMRWHVHPINQAREELGLPTINSIWLSGIGKTSDVQIAPELRSSQRIMSDLNWLEKITQEFDVQLTQELDLNWKLLPEKTLICHSQAKNIWPAICQLLIEHDLEVEVIDFPKSIRKRYFRSADFRSNPLTFWRKPRPPEWNALIQ